MQHCTTVHDSSYSGAPCPTVNSADSTSPKRGINGPAVEESDGTQEQCCLHWRQCCTGGMPSCLAHHQRIKASTAAAAGCSMGHTMPPALHLPPISPKERRRRRKKKEEEEEGRRRSAVAVTVNSCDSVRPQRLIQTNAAKFTRIATEFRY
jgi:hypothetical protein